MESHVSQKTRDMGHPWFVVASAYSRFLTELSARGLAHLCPTTTEAAPPLRLRSGQAFRGSRGVGTTDLGSKGLSSGPQEGHYIRSLFGSVRLLEGFGRRSFNRRNGGGHGFLRRRLFGGFGAFALLVATIVELLVGSLFLHSLIMSQRGGGGESGWGTLVGQFQGRVPSAAKAAIHFCGLRGAEAPLFHVTAGIWEFFRNL